MFIAYLIIAVAVIGLTLILMAFAYPELLWRVGKGLFRLSIRGAKAVIKFIVAGEKRIGKSVAHTHLIHNKVAHHR